MKSVELGPVGVVARVIHVESCGRAFVRLQKDDVVIGINGDDEPLERGDVLLLNFSNNTIETVDEGVWLEPLLEGVVRGRSEGETRIESGGKLHRVPTTAVEYTEGDEVRWFESRGVVEVVQGGAQGGSPSVQDVEAIQSEFRRRPNEPKLEFSDFAGMDAVKQRARDLVEVPLLHAESLQRIGARPIKGVLFTGHPGTGKTHLARVIADQADAIFYEVSGPAIMDKWVGESERRLRDLFTEARAQARAIIFFDEMDSIASARTDDSNESARRVVAQLLTELDGFVTSSNIIVIGATNRPDDIDPALRRPGRFDWQVRFPLPTAADRFEILSLGASKVQVSADLPHARVVQATAGWTPAEISVIWSEAAMLAAKDGRESINESDYLGGLQRRQAERELRAVREREETHD